MAYIYDETLTKLVHKLDLERHTMHPQIHFLNYILLEFWVTSGGWRSQALLPSGFRSCDGWASNTLAHCCACCMCVLHEVNSLKCIILKCIRLLYLSKLSKFLCQYLQQIWQSTIHTKHAIVLHYTKTSVTGCLRYKYARYKIQHKMSFYLSMKR